MSDFQTSTHRAKWIFTPQELVAKYRASNRRAIQTLEEYGTTQMEVDIDGSFSYPEPQKDNAEKHSRPKPLSIEEEQSMRVFYENKLREVCSAFYFPNKIQATALLYFKRFYLQWSVMEHHPKNIMLTCVYAACKIEENHVSAEELGKGISQDHQMILNYEMIVYQAWGLEFDLIVYAPYRPLEGFVIDMEEFCQATNGQLQMLKDLHESAKLEVDRIMLTDAPLLFPPGQLALAALRCANNVHRVLDFERYIEGVLSQQNSAHTYPELLEYLDAIDSWVMKYKFPSEKDMKHINRKLKSCWGHSSHDEGKKREKKSKHKSKSSNEMQNGPTLVVEFDPSSSDQCSAPTNSSRGSPTSRSGRSSLTESSHQKFAGRFFFSGNFSSTSVMTFLLHFRQFLQ